MPSTYTLNNGIEIIATGEQSGTWGDTTNTNLSLIDTALDGQVSITLAATGSSGSPNGLPITDGAASNGRNRLVIFGDGGDLGGTAYVQLTPSDSEKIVYVRNNLSGSRSILLFQGTYNASNDYEVPAGKTAVVFFNGSGSGSVAANVFNNAHFDALNVVGAAAIGTTLTVGTSVNIASSTTVNGVLDEDNMSSNSATKLATQQSIKAYVDSQVTAQDLDIAGDGGTGSVDLDSQTFTVAGTSNEIETAASGQTITVGLPNAVTISTLTASTVDINGGAIDGTNIGASSAGTGAFTSLTANGGGSLTGTWSNLGTVTTVDINGGTIDGSVIGGASSAAGTFTTLVADTSLNIAGDGATVTGIKDEDNMASNSATKLATQQSIKAYVDSQVTAQDLDFQGDSGTGSIDLDSQTLDISGTANQIVTSASGQTLTVSLPATVATTTADLTNIEVTNIKAKDGTAAGSIANSTGVVTFSSAVLSTADINGGTVDGAVIGGSTAAAGTFTSLNATGGGSLTGTWSNLGTVTTIDINGGSIDGTVIGANSAAAGTFTNITATGGSITGITDLAVADGGTGASTAAAARTNLDVDQAGTALALAIALG